jgi:signal transduction histidine kinase/DNA-binding LacI/PurR family transcriptional regulator
MMKDGKRLTIAYINTLLHEDWAFPPWIGAAEAAREHGVNLVSFHGNAIRASGYLQQENIIYEIAVNPKIDGLVIWKGNLSSDQSDAEFESFCTRFGVPFVIIEGFLPGYPSITYGNYEGMRMVIDHLIETHGYTKIGIVGHINADTHAGFKARYRAYCDSMKDHSLAVDPSWVTPARNWDVPPDGLSMDDVLDIWLREKLSQGLEAVVGICDPVSLWVIEHCKKLGYSVPDDIAVAGYDNFIAGRVSTPPLTTVDPSWIELGTLALETVVDMIRGKQVPEKRVVEAKLVIARSCGCMEESVTRASQVHAPGIRFFDDGDAIIDEMVKVVHGAGNGPIRSACESMLASFTEEKTGENEHRFLSNLENALAISMDKEEGVLSWQDAISELQKYAAIHPGGDGISYANILCHQGRVMIGNAASRVQGHRRLEFEGQIDRERNFGLDLITTFDLDRLLDLLASGLPGLGISRFYLSLYEDPKSYVYPEPAPGWSRLVLACNDEGRIRLDPDGILYKTRDLLPDSVWPNEKPLNLSVHALCFQDTQIGTLMFDAIPSDKMVFEVFRVQLSSALKGVLLVKKVEQQMRELTASNEELARSYGELKRNQQALLVSEKMASLGRLSAGIAHEMNTPLAAVRAALREIGLLVDEYRDSIENPGVTADDHRSIAADLVKNLSIATQATVRSVEFIKGVKSQVTPQASGTIESFNACELATETLAVLEHLIKKGNCTLVMEMLDDVFILGNPRAFSQILTNLLVNAIDACKPGGGTIAVSMTKNPDQAAVLTIRDTGVGIEKEILGKIFDPFFSTKPFGEGAGLGLSIVYELVNEFGGTIGVESSPGDTVFRITFPFRDES